jgi:UDP-3-O-[3-hydroxymyristoyl] glucosamine N-acyltransferase
MRFDTPVSVQWIAEFIQAEISGDSTNSATGINEIHKVENGDIVFVDHPKYYDKCIQSAASFIIIDKKVDCPAGKTLLVVPEPFEAYLKLVNHFRPFVASTKMISDSASIGKDTIIMPNSFIGNHVSIGKSCVIYPNVTILDHCVIGDHVIIQSGTVIGSDAFYYNRKTNRDIQYKRMNSCGNVIIENFVEVGAGCTIDRGVSGDTIVGAGTKLDNMVQIGHDTEVGKNCLFAAQVAVAGAVKIEEEVILWGQVGVNKTLTIGKGTVILAQSGIRDTISPNKVYFGSPAEEAREKMKEFVWIKRIPQLWEKVMGK